MLAGARHVLPGTEHVLAGTEHVLAVAKYVHIPSTCVCMLALNTHMHTLYQVLEMLGQKGAY